MDFASVLGLVVAVAGLLVGFVMDGGSPAALWQPSAALIVFGGTIGATMLTTSLRQFSGVFSYLKVAFLGRRDEPLAVIDELAGLASLARREGILALEEKVEDATDSFMERGIRSIVDGVDPELVKHMLETELMYLEERHEAAIKVFEAAGGYAPTMGIIGTVMGLIHVLGNLQDVSKLGPLIATAFTATLYGVASANVFWLPVANKLRKRNEDERLVKEIVMEGVLSIQAGENPTLLGQKLRAFLAPSMREAKSTERVGRANAATETAST